MPDTDQNLPLPTLTGATRFFPLVGYPIGQVRTPPLFNAHFARSSVDALMFPVEIGSEQVGTFLTSLRGWTNCGGCSVTIPHKQAALQAVDNASARAVRVGAVNIIRRDPNGTLHGEMTDGQAMVAALRYAGADLSGATALLIGAAGGAGAAVADALCEAGILRLDLVDVRADRCQHLAERLQVHYPATTLGVGVGLGRYDIAVNASPVGMTAGDPLPFDLSLVRPAGVVADVVTKPLVTPLIRLAETMGYAVVTGDQMAAAQLTFQMQHLGLWYGESHP